MRILHIEDDLSLQKLVSRGLARKFTAEVVTVDSPDTAIEALQTGNFDIVVSDYNIKDGTGGQVLEWVRANIPTQRFMFLSDDDNIVSSGVPYVRKPAPMSDVCRAIEDIIK